MPEVLNEKESCAAGLNLEKYSETSYQLIKTVCRADDLEGQIVYGIRAERFGANLQCAQCAQIEDISSNKNIVLQLISLLEKGKVEPEQLIYIVEDFLVEIY